LKEIRDLTSLLFLDELNMLCVFASCGLMGKHGRRVQRFCFFLTKLSLADQI
jgi:hypothetical protein